MLFFIFGYSKENVQMYQIRIKSILTICYFKIQID